MKLFEDVLKANPLTSLKCAPSNKDSNGNNSLFLAVIGNHISIVKLLIERGYSILDVNSHGDTIAHLAIQYGKEILLLLLS